MESVHLGIKITLDPAHEGTNASQHERRLVISRRFVVHPAMCSHPIARAGLHPVGMTGLVFWVVSRLAELRRREDDDRNRG
jgi:hypothetical protein